MSDVLVPEVLPHEGGNLVQDDTVALAKTVAAKVTGVLDTAPDNVKELVKAVVVECEPIVVHKVTVRLELR